jgi:hypothetical protein
MTIEDPSAPAARAKMTPARRALAAFFFADLLLGAGAMMFSTHLPSPLAVRIALAGGGACGLFLAWQARDGGMYSAANRRFAATGRGAYIMNHVWLRVPLMGVFGFLITYSALESGVFGAVTTAIGQPGARTLTITSVTHGGRGCGHFDVRETGFLVGQALCATPQQLAQAHPGDRLLATGAASPFGLNVKTLQVEAPAWGATGP